ncbi:Protein LIFEGUARD 4 [Camellia lanceoleosa]|uniref:Protein LIFEGUARD 4 n=1 Tax=Camellia lanceoleosa TaxID=1840588 RepID=A0ACC0H196_9ERIC|nr:Protein LIFEGUARD 4 [Camellia lanceoleosa]
MTENPQLHSKGLLHSHDPVTSHRRHRHRHRRHRCLRSRNPQVHASHHSRHRSLLSHSHRPLHHTVPIVCVPQETPGELDSSDDVYDCDRIRGEVVMLVFQDFLRPFLITSLVVLIIFGLIQVCGNFLFLFFSLIQVNRVGLFKLCLLTLSLQNCGFNQHIFIPLGKLGSTTYGGIGAIIFSGFIIYDTDNLIKRLNYDEYTWAAVCLYLDITNLFLALLDALGGGIGGSSRNTDN